MRKKIFHPRVNTSANINKFKLQKKDWWKVAIPVVVLFIGIGLFLTFQGRAATKLAVKELFLPDKITYTKTDKDGNVLFSEEKAITVDKEKGSSFVNGMSEDEMELAKLTNNYGKIKLTDLDDNQETFKNYFVSFDGEPGADVNSRLTARGVPAATRIPEVAAYRQSLAGKQATIQDRISKAIGKPLTKNKPQKGARNIKFEYLDLANGISIEVSPDEAEKIRKVQGVTGVTEATLVKTSLNESVPMIGAPSVWPLVGSSGFPLTGFGIKIGVVDTGVDYTHPDLGGCFGGNCKVAGGYDYINNDSNPMDDQGHGTHVAATAAGNGIAADGTVLKGVAPNATIYGFKVLGAGGTGSSNTVAAGMEGCLDPNRDGNYTDKLDVCTLSLGGSGNPDGLTSKMADKLMENGVITTIAAGNSGPSSGTIGSPGTSRLAITVGAACKPGTLSGSCEQPIASFSSRGPVEWVDKLGVSQTMSKPDIVAPGVQICAAEWGTWLLDRRCKDDAHIAISGTSMATPHVAGVVALMRQALPYATTLDIKSALKNSATPYPGFDENTQGKGLINVLSAIKFLAPDLDFKPAISSNPSYLITNADLTKTTSTFTQTFSLKNTTTTTQTATLSVTTPNGVTIQLDQSSLNLSADQTTSLTATVTADTAKLIGGTIYQGIININLPTKTLKIPVTINVPTKIKTNPVVLEMGNDSFSGTTWTTSKPFNVQSLVSFTQSYTTTVKCCFVAGTTTVQPGASLGLTPSSFTLGGNVTTTINANLSVDPSVPSGAYEGVIILSSPGQSDVSIPIFFTKYYKMSAKSVQLCQDQTNCYLDGVAYPTTKANSMATRQVSASFPEDLTLLDFYFLEKPTWNLDFMTKRELQFDKFSGCRVTLPSGVDRLSCLEYIIVENIPFEHNKVVSIDFTKATNSIVLNPTDAYGNDLSTNRFSMQSVGFKNLSNGFPAYYRLFGNYEPQAVTRKVNNLSSNYAVTAYAQLAFEGYDDLPRNYNFNYYKPGPITGSLTFANTKDEVKYMPIYANHLPKGPDVSLSIYSCNNSVGGGLEVCHGTKSFYLKATEDYKLLNYELPAKGVVDANNNTKLGPDYPNISKFQMIDISGRKYGPGTLLLAKEDGSFLAGSRLPAYPACSISIPGSRALLGALPYLVYPFINLFADKLIFSKFSCIPYSPIDSQQSEYTLTSLGGNQDSPSVPWRVEVLRDGVSIYNSVPPLGKLEIPAQPGNYKVTYYTDQGVPISTTNPSKFNNSYSFTIPAGATSVSVPSLSRIQFLTNGRQSTVIDNNFENKLRFRVVDNNYQVFLQTPTLRVKLGTGTYQNIALTKDAEGFYNAVVPKLGTGANYGFEITATNAVGSSVNYTFDLPTGALPDPTQLLPPPPPAPVDTTPPTASAFNLAKDGTPLYGTYVVKGSAQDFGSKAYNSSGGSFTAPPSGLAKIEAYIDDATNSANLIYSAPLSGDNADFSFNLDTTKYSNGSHNLILKAYDKIGNQSTNGLGVNYIFIGINPNPNDTAAPVGSYLYNPAGNPYFYYPLESLKSNTNDGGPVYRGTVNYPQISFTDNIAMNHADYFIDDSKIGPSIYKGYPATAIPSSYYLRGISYYPSSQPQLDTTKLVDGKHQIKLVGYDQAGNTTTQTYNFTVANNVADTIAPSAPTNLVATYANGNANLTWTASTDNIGVTGYEVWRSVGTGTFGKIADVTTTSYTNSGLSSSTTYNYYVKAKDAANNVSAQSNTVQVTTPTPDTAPTATITAPLSGATVGGITPISATAADDKGVAKVEYFVDGLSIGISTTGPFTINWDTTKLLNGSHAIRVRATDTIGQIGDSAIISVTVQNGDTNAPSNPSGLAASASAYNRVNLSWTASTDNVGVTIYYIVRGGVTIGQVAGNTTTYADTATVGGTSYSYYIVAGDAAGNRSGNSNTATVTTPQAPDTAVPTAPTNLSGTPISASQINLSWTASTDNVAVAGYDIYRNSAKINTNLVTTTSYGDTGLTAGTTYSYYVIAKDAAGNQSPQSSTVSATTQQIIVAYGFLRGTVNNAKLNKALNNVSVMITYTNGTRYLATTDQNGFYSLSGITQGTYNAVYSKPNYISQTVSVTINGNQTTVQNINLQPK